MPLPCRSLTRSYTVDMLDGDAIKTIIETEKPDYIVPEIEAIATDALVELEKEGFNVCRLPMQKNST